MRAYLMPMALAGVGAVIFMAARGTPEKNEKPVIPRSHSKSLLSRQEAQVMKEAQANTYKNPVAVTTGVERAALRTAAFDEPYQFFHDRLTKLNDCLDSRACNYPQRDPKAYDLAIHAETRRVLATLRKWQDRHHYKDSRITDLMVGFLEFEHVGVKQEALSILATQPTDRSALDPLMEFVIEQPQPEVIAAGMKELKRYYVTRADRARIDESFEHVLREGAVFAAIEIAKNLKPFIHRENRAQFLAVRRDLTRTQLADDVIEALDESLN